MGWGERWYEVRIEDRAGLESALHSSATGAKVLISLRE